jgi:hypothetical protein
MNLTKLFDSKHISLEERIDEDGKKVFIAFNEDLLRKNVLIEFYEEIGKPETVIFAISRDEARSYTFMLFLVCDIMKPLEVLGLVADVVDFISKRSRDTLFEDLEEIAIGVGTSDGLRNKKESERIYEADSRKFNTAMEL